MTPLVTTQEARLRVELPKDKSQTQKFEQAVFESQERYTRTILCKKLYDRVLASVKSGSFTSPDETLWEDHIKPSLIFRAYSRYLPHCDIKAFPSGLKKPDSEDSETLELGEKQALTRQAIQDAEFWEGRMKKYLEDNYETKAIYKDCCQKKTTPNSFGISSIGGKKPARIVTVDGAN